MVKTFLNMVNDLSLKERFFTKQLYDLIGQTVFYSLRGKIQNGLV